MTMKWNNILFTLALALIISVMSSCDGDKNNSAMTDEAKENVNKTGFPIVDDEITLDIFTGKSNLNNNIDWNDGLPVWDKYEDMTNIQLNWVEQVHQDSLEEKRNLALGGGKMPDVFFASKVPNSDISKYGEQGVFLELNDLIDEYAPNLKKLMEENPDLKKGMTFPDGNIYSMPYIQDNDFLSMRMGPMPWFDESWLEELDMNVPETTDEFYEFLKGVKDANTDFSPYGGEQIDHLIGWVRGAFGLTGSNVSPDGDLRFEGTTDEYREMLEYTHKLYDEELINQNIFTIDFDQYMSNAADEKYASTMWWEPEAAYGHSGYTGGTALKGPNGDQFYTGVSLGRSNGEFIITNENPNPAATIRWMDYFYSDEGTKLMYMGIEDESFTEDDGEYQYVDEIKDAVNTDQKISEYVPSIGTNPPGIIKAEYFNGAESSDKSMRAAEKIEPYVLDEIPSIIYTRDEEKVMNSVGADINKYVGEMRDKFISGEESLDDSSWEKYKKSIEDMGVDEIMSVEKDAYERYKNN